MVTNIENLKNEISEIYIKDFKKQLGWFKSIIIFPIQKDIKSFLMGKGSEKFNELEGLGIRNEIIHYVSPQFSNKIIEFAETKRLEIEKRKTESDLIQLKNEILGLTGAKVDDKVATSVPGDSKSTQGEDPVSVPSSSVETSEEVSASQGESIDPNPGVGTQSVNEEDLGTTDGTGTVSAENGEPQDVSAQQTQESNEGESVATGVETAVVGGISTASSPIETSGDVNAPQGESIDQTPGVGTQSVNEGNSGTTDGTGTVSAENGEPQDASTQEAQENSKGKAIDAGVETAVVGGTSTIALQKIAASKIVNIEQLDAKEIKSTLESVISITENKRNAIEHRLTTKQLATVDKHIENLKMGLKDIDLNVLEVLKERSKLGDRFKISRVILENCGLTLRQLSEIGNMADELFQKSPAEVRTILNKKGIKTIDESIIEAFCKAQNPGEIKAMTQILRNGNKVPRMLQTLAGALRIDVAFTGLDVWMFIELRKQAELISKINKLRGENKYSQAWTQLGIGISSVAIEGLAVRLMGSAAAGGPIGIVVGLAVGAMTAAASIGVDSLYFDVKDFYLQNQEDFLRQKRSQLKQTILQGIHNRQRGDQSINEHITSFFSPSLKPGSELKEKSLNDACTSMIFLEEIGDGGKFANNNLLYEYICSNQTKDDFLSNKDQKYKDEFEKIWKAMGDRIDKRIQYISKEFEKPDVLGALDDGTGMQYVTTLFTNSRIFVDLKELGKWDESKSIDQNLQNYKTNLFSEIPSKKLQKFEELRQNNPSLFLDIVNTVTEDAFLFEDPSSQVEPDNNYIQNVKMVVAYKNWLNFTQNIEDKKYLNVASTSTNGKFIENLLKSDFDLSKTNCPTISPERVVCIANSNSERIVDSDISDDLLQNILYRLARELFGYSEKNDKQSLMGFYSESSGNNQGIYYSKKWKLNNDWRFDKGLETISLDQDTIHEKDIETYTNIFMSQFFKVEQKGKGENYKSEDNIIVKQKKPIDTPTESIDDNLNNEFRQILESIVREELSNRTIENKEKVKNQILDFVKQHSQRGRYIELPNSLILEAKKAGLGDLQRQFFRRENDKLEICYLPSELNQTPLFPDAEKSYISPTRESFTEEEQYYVDRVDTACQKIEALRNVTRESTFGFKFDDELFMPIAIEHLISEKINQRKIFKQNTMLYYEGVAGEFAPKYKEFAIYFENLYRGILTSIMGFQMSASINSFAYFSQSLEYGNKNIFDESGNIIPIDSVEILNDPDFKEFYDEQIQTLKIGTKTIKELWMSDNTKEKELAKQASNTIYTVVLEKCLLNILDNKIIQIRCGYDSYERHYYDEDGKERIEIVTMNKSRKYIKDNIITELTDRFKKMKIEPDINSTKIKSMLKPQEIKKLDQTQKAATDIAPKIQNQIENIMKNVDWKYKRGDIQFDPGKSTLKSWNNETKIILPKDGNITTVKLDGLDINFSMEEGLRLANFKNRLKYTYTNKQVEFTRGIFNRSFAFRKTFYVDDVTLITRKDLEKYCPACTSDDVVEKITNWLNR